MKALDKDRKRRYETANGFAKTSSDTSTTLLPLAPHPLDIDFGNLYVAIDPPLPQHQSPFQRSSLDSCLLHGRHSGCGWRRNRPTTVENSLRRALHREQQSLTAAEDARTALRKRNYNNTMSVAFNAYTDGDLDHVSVLLEECVPRDGGQDLRGYEWLFWLNSFGRVYRGKHFSCRSPFEM